MRTLFWPRPAAGVGPRLLRTTLILTAAGGLLLGSLLASVPAGADEPAYGGTDDPKAATTFQNPINPGADPTIVHEAGNYYLSTTTGNRIAIWKSPSLATLGTAEPVDVWTAPHPTDRDPMVWAPAMANFDGRWYVYFTWSETGEDVDHRMYVLESEGADPLGPYTLKNKIVDYGNYAIDGEPFSHNGQLYFAWSSPGRGFPGGPNQIYATKMANPWTLEGDPVALPVDNGGCEEVREGPTPLRKDNRLFLTYSTCDTAKPDYQLWMISIEDGQDFLDPAAWTTYPEAILTRNDEAGVYGPGHHFFFTSPDRTEDWIAYHGKETDEHTAAGRTTRAEKFTWNDDGTPNLPRPAALSAEIPLPSGDPGE